MPQNQDMPIHHHRTDSCRTIRRFSSLAFSVLFFIAGYMIQASHLPAKKTVFSLASSLPGRRCENIFASPQATISKGTLYAIHVLRQLPTDGVLHMAREPGLVRLTIHFALGHMVSPHLFGSWEDRTMAVLVPAMSLRPQLINVKEEDTFIVGDFKLPAGSVMVVLEDIPVPADFPIPVVRFSKDTTLRSAIEKALGSSKQDVIDTPEYWREIGLSDERHSSVLHSETPFQKLESLILESVDPFIKNQREDVFMRYVLEDTAKIREAIQSTDGFIENLNLQGIAKISWLQSRGEAEAYVNLLTAEQKLFVEYKKTVRPLIPQYGSILLELSSRPSELWQFIMEHIDEWPLERSHRGAR